MKYPAPPPHYQNQGTRDHHFNTIVGHHTVKQMLWKMILTGRLPQGLLFRGGRGVGKRSMAYALAKLVNGQLSDVSDETPSRVARNIASGDYLDLRVVEPSGPGGQIRIDDVRDIVDWAYVTPIEAKRKILILQDADRMNVASANCFLKTLEEPPAYCLIILTTASPHMLLPTIRSRCSAVYFHPVPEPDMIEWLSDCFGMKEEPARMAALLGDGRPGFAVEQLVKVTGGNVDDELDLWDQVASAPEEDEYGVSPEARRRVAELVHLLYTRGFAGIFGLAFQLVEVGRGNLEATLTLMLMWYRDLAMRAVSGDDRSLIVNRDLPEELWSADKLPTDPVKLGLSIRHILDAFGDCRRPGMDPRLVLENLLLRLGEAAR